MSLRERVLHRSVTRLARLAAVLALIGLAMMVYSIISPRPLPVVLAMSVGQGFGIAAFACYLLAVLIDVARGTPRTSLPPGPAAESEREPKLEPDSD